MVFQNYTRNMMSNQIVKIIQCFAICVLYCAVDTVNGDTDNDTEGICKVAFSDGQDRLNTSAKIKYITLDFQNFTKMQHLQHSASVYNLHEWIITAGTYGSGLLQLRSIYEILSLKSLSLHTKHSKIVIKKIPEHCMEATNASEFELTMRRFLLHQIDKNEEVCNVHIGNDSGYAEFYYECCTLQSEKVECYVIRKNLPMKMIDICTYIIVVLVILYCPLLIPSSLYKRKYEFVHHLAKPIKIICSKTEDSFPSEKIYFLKAAANETNNEKNAKRTKYVFGMNFQNLLTKMTPKISYELEIETVHIKITDREIISENKINTGFLHTFYNTFIKCGKRLKYDRTILNQRNNSTCCFRNVLGQFTCCKKEYPWYKCLRICMHVFLVLLVCLPLVIRIYVYYLFEHSQRNQRLAAAVNRNLEFPFRESLIYYLTPVHVLFIVSYFIIFLEWILFGFVSKKVKYLMKEMMQICFVDMTDEKKKSDKCKWALHTLIFPMKHCGIFGVFLCVFFWPVILPYVIIVFSFYMFPTVRLCLTMVFIIIYDIIPSCKKICMYGDISLLSLIGGIFLENFGIQYIRYRKSSKKIIRFVQIFISILAVCSIGLLTVECIIFLIDVAVYTMIGLILNSSHAMQYITAISIAWFYFQRCFNGNNGIYLRYNKAIQNKLQKDNEQKLTEVADLDPQHQENEVFLVENARSEVNFFVNTYGKPMLTTHGAILLLDSNDNLYIERSFFEKACDIEHPLCPGPVHEQILSSLRRFLSIIMFLIFVTLVVMAFGETYSISISNQLLATVAGGFVPFILMKSKILFKNPVNPDLNELSSSISFKSRLRDKIKTAQETWRISDMGGNISKIQTTDEVGLIVHTQQSQTMWNK